MTGLSLRQRIQHYIDAADERLLNMIKALVESYHDDRPEWVSIEQYNEEIDQSIAQIERGAFYTHKEVGERIKQWAER